MSKLALDPSFRGLERVEPLTWIRCRGTMVMLRGVSRITWEAGSPEGSRITGAPIRALDVDLVQRDLICFLGCRNSSEPDRSKADSG
jgi:hypothetical protein